MLVELSEFNVPLPSDFIPTLELAAREILFDKKEHEKRDMLHLFFVGVANNPNVTSEHIKKWITLLFDKSLPHHLSFHEKAGEQEIAEIFFTTKVMTPEDVLGVLAESDRNPQLITASTVRLDLHTNERALGYFLSVGTPKIYHRLSATAPGENFAVLMDNYITFSPATALDVLEARAGEGLPITSYTVHVLLSHEKREIRTRAIPLISQFEVVEHARFKTHSPPSAATRSKDRG